MTERRKPFIINPGEPQPDLSRSFHLHASQEVDDQEREQLERELAAKHGGIECAENGHDWDIAVAGGGMWTFDCTRPDCKLVHDSEDGYIWSDEPA